MISISSIASSIKSMFDGARSAAPTIPSVIMSIGGMMRPGMSTQVSCSNIARALAKHGIPTDAAEDGSENKTMALVIAIVEEVFRAIKEDANIQVAFKPGDITVLTTGANGGGPMVSQGININFPQGTAVLQ